MSNEDLNAEVKDAIQDLQSAAATLRLVTAIVINGHKEGKVDDSIMQEVAFALDLGMGEDEDAE